MDRATLQRLSGGRNTPQKMVARARIVLLSADRVLTGTIMERLGVTTPTISRWRKRYEVHGAPGLLKDKSRPGRRRRIGDAQVRTIVEKTLQEKPVASTQWSTRSLAKATGVSGTTVQRIWKALADSG